MTEDTNWLSPTGVNARLAASTRELEECREELAEARRQLAEIMEDAHNYNDIRVIDGLRAQLARQAATHSPDVTCNCPEDPLAAGKCEYRILADAVDASFNTRDGDAAEVALHIDAVERIARFVASLPCTCPPGDPDYVDEPCGRCTALNQVQGKPAQR